jgi:hypothetical protein
MSAELVAYRLMRKDYYKEVSSLFFLLSNYNFVFLFFPILRLFALWISHYFIHYRSLLASV